jgi:hypothetical protein
MPAPSRRKLLMPDFNSGPYIGEPGILLDDKLLDDLFLFEKLEDNFRSFGLSR